jgi:hypothetical protein
MDFPEYFAYNVSQQPFLDIPIEFQNTLSNKAPQFSATIDEFESDLLPNQYGEGSRDQECIVGWERRDFVTFPSTSIVADMQGTFFRPSELQYKLTEVFRNASQVASTFQNSQYSAHYRNKNFQPEEWTLQYGEPTKMKKGICHQSGCEIRL